MRHTKHEHRMAFVGKLAHSAVDFFWMDQLDFILFFVVAEMKFSLGPLGLKAWATHLAQSCSLPRCACRKQSQL